MNFVKYPKIHRLGKEEVEGILEGMCVVQEKVDGANTQIWFEDGFIRLGSRSKQITEGFNGFVDYVMTNEPIKNILADHPDWRLFGEWLVRHTLAYRETSYRTWYMFDIMLPDGKFMEHWEVSRMSQKYGIPMPQIFDTVNKPKVEDIKKFVGQTCLGDKGEGVVIKNLGFLNSFGECCYAKIVTEEFKEDNAVAFGGNNKHSDTYHEVYVINKYMTLSRVKKIMDKIQPTIDKRLDMEHIPRICNTAYHDMLSEEIWSITKDVPKLDLKVLQRIAFKKAKQIYVDILNDDINIHDQTGERDQASEHRREHRS